MAVSKIFLIYSALLIVGGLADTKVQWEAPEIELSNEEHELFAFKTLGEGLMAPQGEENLLLNQKSWKISNKMMPKKKLKLKDLKDGKS